MPMPNRLPPVEGDMVVTAVARHYAIGCVTAECDTGVFLAHSKRMSELIDCTDVARYAKASTV